MTYQWAALLLACCALCASAVESQRVDVKDPLQIMNERFSKTDAERCITALLCLWLELVQLPRRRMIERVDAVFEQFQSAINAAIERAKLHMDETFTSTDNARGVLFSIRSHVEEAQRRQGEMGKGKQSLIDSLKEDTAVVGQMFEGLSAIVTVAGGLSSYGTSILSLASVKAELSALRHFNETSPIAKEVAQSIIASWWRKDASDLVANLAKLISNSSEVCVISVPKHMWPYIFGNYQRTIDNAGHEQKFIAKYMETIGDIDKFDGRDGNVLTTVARRFLSSNITNQVQTALKDMFALQNTVRRLRVEQDAYLAEIQLKKSNQQGSCTALWKQLLSLVGLE
ncbi:hypothetical protein ERJ75_000264000 [Trypanosoma vivax]|nr:hypothetical protein ERJ75_000264000 [Trypanosoma vivax]